MTTNRGMRAIRNVSQYVRSVGVKALYGDSANPPRKAVVGKFYPKRDRSKD